jgi:hypothetical protein
MRKFFLLFVVIIVALGSAYANDKPLKAELVRKALLSSEVKGLLTADGGNSLPVRIVYQSDNSSFIQAFYPSQENLVVVKDTQIESKDGILIAKILLNINGEVEVEQVFTCKDEVNNQWVAQTNSVKRFDYSTVAQL